MRTSIPYVKTPTDAYIYMLDYINRKGDQVIDENGYNTKELLNIQKGKNLILLFLKNTRHIVM